ncbi:MAG TPA: hypothetical protein VL361_25595 [Candidatus Limnocylindrales bacterium]|jgi:hypothetical protein|nr:hypothetical protein [Candidatus Limnocylindrales bacterium]
MNNNFDELAKSMAQSVTRRAALGKLGVGLAGMALACVALAYKAKAATRQGYCQIGGSWYTTDVWYTGACMDVNGCVWSASADWPADGTRAGSVAKGGKFKEACGQLYSTGKKCSFTI